MTQLGILTSFLFLINSALGQNDAGDPTVQFSRKEYRSDFRQFVKLLKQNHPQTYTFTSKKEFHALQKQKLHEFSDATSLGQFLWACEDVAAAIQCVHTYIWWPEDFRTIPDSLRFSLDVWTDGKKLFVANARNNASDVENGSEILSINGVDSKSLIQVMYASSPTDGNIESAKRDWINHVFNAMCPMYFNYPQHYNVTVKSESGEIKTIQLEKYQRIVSKTDETNIRPAPLRLEIDSVRSLGILTVETFSYYETDFPEFQSFVDSSFNTINTLGIKHLVVDIRGNQGGDPYCGSYLIQHIADKPYCYWPIDENAEFYADLHQMIQPNENRFEGDTYIFVDGGCLSTSGHVGSILKDNEFGTIIGEEMGSTFICNDNSLHGALKHTGLRYSIARTTYATCVSGLPNNKGVLPDIEILKTLEDVLSNSDPLMEYVIKLIE